jgi:DNA mismatch repair protein MutS2
LRKSAGIRLKKQVESAPITSSSFMQGPQPSAVSQHKKPGPDAQSFELQEESLEDAAAPIRERDRVRITSLNSEGKVESISGDNYTVLVGALRFKAKRQDLRLLRAVAASKQAAGAQQGVTATARVDDSFKSEINVIGTTVDEATDRVDKFLDEAYLAGVASVRIVHGQGTGALRRAISQMLSSHPHVESFQNAPQNQGGSGATLADLRK